MKNIKKSVYLYLAALLIFVSVAGVSYAAFVSKARLLGSSFSVGSAQIKLLQDLGGGTGAANLVDEKPGPAFANISPNWTSDYLIKVYNNGTSPITLTSNANYETANDPGELRQIIYVEPFAWNDADADGILDTGELGASLGVKDTIVKYKTVGYNLGQVNSGEVKSIVLRFSTTAVSDTKQGLSGMFDFEFNSAGL